MPTGYTCAVQTGEVTDFPTFAMQCARAMGACVTMRDDPQDKAIPEKFEPDNYYAKQIVEAEARIKALQAMSGLEKQSAAEDAYQEKLNRWNANKRRQEEERARYEAMLTKVRNWLPPTKDHTGLQEFMVQQLESSIKFDCGYEQEPPKEITPDEWYAAETDEAFGCLERSQRYQREEVLRAAERTDWIKSLRHSLATYEPVDG